MRHATLSYNYRLGLQIIRKRSILAGEMYATICVKWAADYFTYVYVGFLSWFGVK